jgi:hypothetical protein
LRQVIHFTGVRPFGEAQAEHPSFEPSVKNLMQQSVLDFWGNSYSREAPECGPTLFKTGIQQALSAVEKLGFVVAIAIGECALQMIGYLFAVFWCYCHQKSRAGAVESPVAVICF